MGSYARKTYIMHEPGARLPEPDTSFRVFVDSNDQFAEELRAAAEFQSEASLCR